MKNLIIKLWILSALILGLALPAPGQEGSANFPGPQGGSMHEGGGLSPNSPRERGQQAHLDKKYNDKRLETLGVSEETRKKIRTMIHDFQKERLEVEFQLSEVQAEVRNIFSSDSLSETSFLATVEKLGELTKRQVVSGLKSELAILSLLTPKQRKDLQQMKGYMEKQKEMEKKN
jgi:Spy/CpxP family protein refolding chaperone